MLSDTLERKVAQRVKYHVPTTNKVIPSRSADWPAHASVPLLVIDGALHAGLITYGHPHPSNDFWSVNVEGTDGLILPPALAAALNPDGIEGHYYRVVNDDGEGPLVRFESNRWVIVSGPGAEEWPHGEDFFSAYTMPMMFYVEVEAPVRQGRLPDPVEPGVEIFQGKVEADATLDPDIDTGALYCVVDLDEPAVIHLRYREHDRWTTLGHWHRADGWKDGEPLTGTPDILSARTHWALAKVGYTPTLINLPPAGQEVERLRGIANVLQAREQNWNTKLNNIAADQDWCERFDDLIIKPLGLRGRYDDDNDEGTDENSDYTVTVEGRFTIEDASPASELDEMLSEHYGIESIESSRLSFASGFTVKLFIEDVADEDDARDHVDDELIHEALTANMGGSPRLSLTQWDITDVEEGDTRND